MKTYEVPVKFPLQTVHSHLGSAPKRKCLGAITLRSEEGNATEQIHEEGIFLSYKEYMKKVMSRTKYRLKAASLRKKDPIECYLELPAMSNQSGLRCVSRPVMVLLNWRSALYMNGMTWESHLSSSDIYIREARCKYILHIPKGRYYYTLVRLNRIR